MRPPVATLFAEEAVTGKCPGDDVHNSGFAFMVDVGHKILVLFGVDGTL